jgi:zinc/manganese transport system permease protein
MFSGFMMNAWVSGTIVAILAGVVGFFVVLRESAFPAHALPNGAFAGALGANLVGVDPLIGLVSFAVVAALGLGVAARRERSDVATALALVSMLALGATFLALSGQYQPGIDALLFGDLLAVSNAEILPILTMAVLSATAIVVVFRPLLLTSVAPDLAVARGVRTARLNTAGVVVLALVTALTVPVVGALLTFALLIGPPAAARTLATRPGRAVALSVVLALGTVWASIASAFQWNWPVGFFVGVYGAALYLASRLARRRRGPTPAGPRCDPEELRQFVQ